MQFKILLTADRPTDGDLVLAAETPLSGVTFMEEAGKCLRKSIDHLVRTRHITLGALSVYEITVPQELAIESGLFESKSTISVIVENDLLSHYIFYGASVSQKSSGRPCYPYMHGEATLCSYIDELQFLQDWADVGFATRLSWNEGLVDASNQSSDTSNRRPGMGCGGCTCHHEEHHHHHYHEPPPPPPPRPFCNQCPPDMGHNAPPSDIPHSSVKPTQQLRPGPKPSHGCHHKPPVQRPSKMHFMC